MPFGVVYSPNLTPDEDTGIGSWTEKMFLDIFRKGRPVLPPMPWTAVASLSDDDIIAIYAYLRSIPPIRNGAPVAQPPLPVQDAIDRSNQKLIERLRG